MGAHIHFAELATYPLVMPGPRDGVRQQVLATAKRLAIPLQVTLDVSSVSMMKNMVARGDAAAIMPYGNVIDDVRQGTIVGRRIADPPLKRTMYLVRPMSRAAFKEESGVLDLIERISPAIRGDAGRSRDSAGGVARRRAARRGDDRRLTQRLRSGRSRRVLLQQKTLVWQTTTVLDRGPAVRSNAGIRSRMPAADPDYSENICRTTHRSLPSQPDEGRGRVAVVLGGAQGIGAQPRCCWRNAAGASRSPTSTSPRPSARPRSAMASPCRSTCRMPRRSPAPPT